jgi:hypothetical protein
MRFCREADMSEKILANASERLSTALADSVGAASYMRIPLEGLIVAASGALSEAKKNITPGTADLVGDLEGRLEQAIFDCTKGSSDRSHIEATVVLAGALTARAKQEETPLTEALVEIAEAQLALACEAAQNPGTFPMAIMYASLAQGAALLARAQQ